MGFFGNLVSYLLLGASVWMAIKIYGAINYIPPMPDLPLNQYWGKGAPPTKPDTKIREFKIEFDPKMVKDLYYRLDNSDCYTEPLEGVGFQYGFNNDYLKDVVKFWRHKYNMTERENFLNQYPHFITNIQGLDIHYVHVKPKVKSNMRILPLLLLHGWPGSIREFYGVIPMLTTPRDGHDYVFELIIPSLPGYGYSEASSKRGLGAAQIAVIMRNLMERIGFEKYYIQGGDWGALITSNMATLYPENILGYHTNAAGAMSPISFIKLFLGSIFPALVVDKENEDRVYPISNTILHFIIFESGYSHIQATKPDTVGVGLNDSPVGLAAYIMEKFSTWTKREWMELTDGGLTKKYTLTDLLDNIMIYWSSGSITTSMRLYSEVFNQAQNDLNLIPVEVPTSIAFFKNELMYSLDWQLRDKYPNMVSKSHFEVGGHFAAFEEPKLFADDLWSSVPKFDDFQEAVTRRAKKGL